MGPAGCPGHRSGFLAERGGRRAGPRAAGLAAEFVEAGVYDAVTALGGRAFDVVYTSIGAILWPSPSRNT